MSIAAMKTLARRCAGRAKAFRRHAGGSAAVEFAIVSPVLLVVLLGVLAYGLYFGTANSVQQLAADAARASVAGMTDDERASIARQRVASASASYALIDPAKASVTAKPSPSDPNLFQVAVSYDASKLSIWAFEGVLPLPSKTIVRSAAIQRGGY